MNDTIPCTGVPQVPECEIAAVSRTWPPRNARNALKTEGRIRLPLIPDFHIPCSELERVKGIEPSSSAWKAVALPLSYTRTRKTEYRRWGSESLISDPLSSV